MNPADSEARLANRILEACDRGTLLDRTSVPSPESLSAAQARQARVSALRQARGERPVGFKIGFTNRTIWPLYGVHHPIWAPVWNTTVTLLDGTLAELSLGRFAQPRLEPEIVFGLASTPASARPEELFESIEWVAHGFEVVQCPYPDWRFDAAEAIAAQSLHGALIVGPRRPRSVFPDWQALASIRLVLSCDGQPVAEGEGRHALDNPVLALGHLYSELAAADRELRPRDIVTTGTLTDAMPLSPEQRWETRLPGSSLAGLVLLTR